VTARYCYERLMLTRAASLALVIALALVAFAVLAACGDSGGKPSRDPTAVAGAGTGPLANLESAPFQNEVWMTPEGQQIGFLYYPRENIRVNATCRMSTGPFICDAMRYMRNGMPVEIARRSLDGRTSAGVKVCMRMNQPIVTVRNSVGAEDSFCRFPDGSLISTGALEQYQMRVMQ
jgi:hypothetical protein